MAFDHSSNPAFSEKYFEHVTHSEEVMTVNGAINKSFLLTFIAFCSSTFTWKMFMEANQAASSILLGSIILTFILSLVIIFYKKSAPYLAPVYAVAEGFILGIISAMYALAFRGSGIVLQALGITFGSLFLMLFLYKTNMIKVTEKFKSGLAIATLSIGIGYLFSFVAGLVGYQVSFARDGIVGIIASVVISIIAVLNFLLDFDTIDRGAQNQLPKYMEWYCAFGLLVTLVWVYLEILKLLGKMKKR